MHYYFILIHEALQPMSFFHILLIKNLKKTINYFLFFYDEYNVREFYQHLINYIFKQKIKIHLIISHF